MDLASPAFYTFPILVVGVTLCHGVVRGDTSIERTISLESNNFSGGTSTVEIATPVNELNEFTADFSMLEEEELFITWSAPPGKVIEITRPAGFDAAFFFEFILETGGTSADDSFDDTDPSVVYVNLTGAIPSEISRLIRLSGSSLEGAEASILDSLAPGESIQFTSLQASTTVDASYDEDIDNLALTEFSLRGTATGGMTDPGQWIRLVDDTTDPVFAPVDPSILQKSRIKRRIKKTKRRIRVMRKSGRNRKVRSLRDKIRKLKAKRRSL